MENREKNPWHYQKGMEIGNMKKGDKSIILYFINRESSIDAITLDSIRKSNDSFSFTVSSSLAGSEDVIILNHNVICTYNWVSRLIDCAESYCSVGTVSPLISVDLSFDNPDINRKWNATNLEKVSDIINQCGELLYPSVKYNLFDCVYIKRQVLDEIGFPSVEEMLNPDKACQWFAKVAQMGWEHKMCTQAYFNGNLLYRNDRFIYSNRLNKATIVSIDKIKENIVLYFDLHLDGNRKKVLHYLLADFQEGTWNNVGGTQFHVHDLVESQKMKYNIFVLARDNDQLRLTNYYNNNIKVFTFYIGKAPEYNIYYDKKHEELYDYLLKLLGIDIVHIHHTMWMPLNIFNTAYQLSIPIILSIHDYYYVCPILKKISPGGNSCNITTCLTDCISCLKNNKGIIDSKAFMQKWYTEHNKVVQMCKKIVFPSDFAFNVMSGYYQTFSEKGCIIEHGVSIPVDKRNYTIGHNKMRVAFIGGISDVKGGPVIYNLIKKDNHIFDWYIIGGIGYPDLYNLEQKNLTKTGWYKREDIYNILINNEIDLICILSTVEETYCYTLSEALATGIPVVATDVGALGDRMRKLNCGWLVSKDISADEIFNLLVSINSNNEEFQQKQKAVSSVYVKSLEDMNTDYDELYTNFLPDPSQKYSVNITALKNAFYCPSIAQSSVIDIDQRTNLIAAERELSEIKSSLLVKIALKLRKLKIPGKLYLKNIVLHFSKNQTSDK